mmetsp:Transcript_62289/g.193293  ORF Transcript_62289/g.193293 Transcript_62289/m.193293 type:complete len:235 (-) Transcript_62289:97-801(-)
MEMWPCLTSVSRRRLNPASPPVVRPAGSQELRGACTPSSSFSSSFVFTHSFSFLLCPSSSVTSATPASGEPHCGCCTRGSCTCGFRRSLAASSFMSSFVVSCFTGSETWRNRRRAEKAGAGAAGMPSTLPLASGWAAASSSWPALGSPSSAGAPGCGHACLASLTRRLRNLKSLIAEAKLGAPPISSCARRPASTTPALEATPDEGAAALASSAMKTWAVAPSFTYVTAPEGQR